MTNIGMIGAGMIANIHAQAAQAVGTNIVAVHDLRKEDAEKFGEEHSCDVVDELGSLLERDDVEAVVVAVPNDRHAELAIASLNASKHVLLEKPMAMSLQQCDDILTARDASRKILQMGFVCRYSPAAMKAKQLIEDGTIGQVHHVQATLLRQRGIPGLGGWFTTKVRSGGGCLIDIGVHLIDLSMHMTSLKSPVRVLGSCTQGFTIASYGYEEMWSSPVADGTFDVEDRVRATIRDKSGTTFQYDVSWATHLPENTMKDGLLFEGSNGALVVDLWTDEMTLGVAQDGNPKEEVIKFDVTDAWDDAFQAEHRAFAHAIEHGSLDVGAGSGEDGRLVQSVVEAIYASNEINQEIAF